MRRLLQVVGTGLGLGLAMTAGMWIGLFMPEKLSAQGTTPSGTSIVMAANAGIPCESPAIGKVAVCFTSAGIMVSNNGAAYAAIAGAVGPKGDKGDPGAVGATGAIGPSGSMSASFTCTSVVLSATGAAFSGCK